MSCKSCCSGTSEGRTDFQYAVKIVCGVVGPPQNPLPPGQYFTAINVHNPSRCDSVTLRWKVAVGLPGLRVGPVSTFAEATLGPDEALEIDCPDVMQLLERSGAKVPEYVKGWVVIETPDELDVVAVYGTAKDACKNVGAFHTERVHPRCLLVCDDFDLNISTGVAAWEFAGPGSSTFSPAALGQPHPVWTNLPNALWLRPGTLTTGGNYTYRLAFKLCSGFRNPHLNLTLVADDNAKVYLNGVLVPIGPNNWSMPASLTASGPFKAGMNELKIVVNNIPGTPTGLQIHGAIEIDNGMCPGSSKPLLTCPGICYRAFTRHFLWQTDEGWWGNWACNGGTAGTTGEHRRLEAFQASLNGAISPGTTVEYRGHVQNLGWTPWTPEGQTCGTTGQHLRMEAVEFRLVNAPLCCHIRYRVHMRKDIFSGTGGWGDWAYDGGQAGTTGQNRRIEAMEVEIYCA